ncbi:MAG: phage repressor protein [bacterium]
MNRAAERLLAGETFVNREPGNSMTPILKSRQPVKLAPITWDKVDVGDIVFCKVRGNHYTHLVKAKQNDRGVLIGNNHGNTNGWTKNVYGRVIEILPMDYEGA